MTLGDLIEKTRIRAEENLHGHEIAQNGRAVMKGEKIVTCFKDENDASAWIGHVYGMTTWQAGKKLGVEMVPIKKLKSANGTLIVYDGSAEFSAMTPCHYEAHKMDYVKPGFGIVLGHDPLMAHFNPYGIWAGEMGFSASGGPAITIKAATLTLIGLKSIKVSRWSGNVPGHDRSGEFWITLPYARWNGQIGS